MGQRQSRGCRQARAKLVLVLHNLPTAQLRVLVVDVVGSDIGDSAAIGILNQVVIERIKDAVAVWCARGLAALPGQVAGYDSGRLRGPPSGEGENTLKANGSVRTGR
jgi:hypothetical protein